MGRQPYPTDLTDTEWAHLQPMLSSSQAESREPTDLREVLNAVLYVLNGGCGEDLLPHELPSWDTVVHKVDQWQQDGTWERLEAAFQEAGLVPVGSTMQTLGANGKQPPAPGLSA